MTLELVPRAPSSADFPAVPTTRVFPDCVLYRDGDRLCYEYGRAAALLVTREGNASFGQLISRDETLVPELGYLFLQSEIGRFLDAQGLHRVHALGLALPSGRAALVLLPSGGGKSTLATEVLRSGQARLLSDDTPLLDRFGNAHPYPLRLSFREDADLPEAWRAKATKFSRRRHGDKLLVPTAALSAEALPRPGGFVSSRLPHRGPKARPTRGACARAPPALARRGPPRARPRLWPGHSPGCRALAH